MPFINKPMVAEWISRNPNQMADMLEANVSQEKQSALETLIRGTYQTPQALIAQYTAALEALKGTGNTVFISALNQAIAEQNAIIEG